MKIIFVTPSTNRPIGGIKVIYRYVEKLNKIGVTSFIMHTIKHFKCTWLDELPTFYNENYLYNTDHYIFTEQGILDHENLLLSNNITFSIFVQNGYHLSLGINDLNAKKRLSKIYNSANLILSISDDTTKILRSFLNIPDKKIVRMYYHKKMPVNHESLIKENLISYMPRKNYDHAQKVVFGLSDKLPEDWKIKPIVDMTDDEVFKTLTKSKIFLSFSNFEGLPAPPIEAAFLYNYVIGYHGQGGKEYWINPVFFDIEPFNIELFVDTVLNQISYINKKDNFPYDEFYTFRESYAEMFSEKNEIESLENLFSRISSLYNKEKEIIKTHNHIQKQRLIYSFEEKYSRIRNKFFGKTKYWEIN